MGVDPRLEGQQSYAWHGQDPRRSIRERIQVDENAACAQPVYLLKAMTF
jgi:hypothetical protein